MGGQGGDHIEVEWLGYEQPASSTTQDRTTRSGHILVSATGGALAALAAMALLGWSNSPAPAASTTTTTTTQPRPPLVGATHQPPPQDGLSDDAACAPLGGSRAC
jgi:hypothetical protein